MYKTGQWIYGIEVLENYFDEAEVSGYLYMGECENYIICCSEYAHHENDFKSQLIEMYEKSICEWGVSLNILKKEFVFDTCEKAKNRLEELQEIYCSGNEINLLSGG